MLVALSVSLCLNLANPTSCVTEDIADPEIVGGLTSCLGAGGQIAALRFAENHPIYRTWQIKGWSCTVGNRPRAKSSNV
jgi:hypothetical protein